MEFESIGKPDIVHGKGAPGKAQLYIDDKLAGETQIPYTLPFSLGLGAGAAVGCDPGSPTIPVYKPPFKFTGKTYQTVIDVSGELIR